MKIEEKGGALGRTQLSYCTFGTAFCVVRLFRFWFGHDLSDAHLGHRIAGDCRGPYR